MDTGRTRAPRGLRTLGWIAVASLLGLALLAPGAGSVAAANQGAIWTSLSDGAMVNANIYDAKADVYLNGGPQNCGNSGGLPDGDYYFQVSDPSGHGLLSSDAIRFRQVEVEGGVLHGVSGDGNHAEGTDSCNGGLPVQLLPYDDTPNNGGEYSVDMASVADVEDCPDFDADSAEFNFLSCTNSKNDNFKVRLDTPAIAIDKVADPTSLPAGGGEVTYTYLVTNPGDVALSDVTVVDDTCSPVGYVSGDEDDNLELDLDESWTFECTMTLTETTTNTAVASGFFGETEVTAEDQAVVTVADATPVPPTTPATASPTLPVQSILAATGTPGVTVPPTDGLGGTAPGPSRDAWRLLLVAMAGLLASILLLTPRTPHET
jgi:uncharacterized repeat protein (TIGR01451 family)